MIAVIVISMLYAMTPLNHAIKSRCFFRHVMLVSWHRLTEREYALAEII